MMMTMISRKLAMQAAIVHFVAHPLIAPAAHEPTDLTLRLSATTLLEPSIAPSALDATLPGWLVGEWDCLQTLVSFSTPVCFAHIDSIDAMQE